MKPPEFCTFPPRIAAGVEISPRGEGEQHAFVIGSPEVGRYLGIGIVEHRVIELLDGTAALPEVCRQMEQRHHAPLRVASLGSFLNKLDDAGILAGGGKQAGHPLIPGSQFYLRWSLFNPDRLFTRMLPVLRFVWTKGFVGASLALMVLSGALSLINRAEVAAYAGHLLREHYLAVFTAAWLVTASHEFAHGMTARAFGGRATEIGGLLIYFCLPALYCNVSGLHLIPQRSRRLWVIAAGVYWQLLVGAASLLGWFAFAPYTVFSNLCMALVLGSLLDLLFNANPLIKLDGYYFLSQWLRLPNLMDRARAYWTEIIFGRSGVQAEREQWTPRDRRIFFVFGLLSYSYNLAFPITILWFASQYLMDRFQFPGLLLSALLAFLYAGVFLKRSACKIAERFFAESKSINEDETVSAKATNVEVSKRARWRHFTMPGLAALCVIGLCVPWSASVGSYGALTARPDREAIIRAPENGSLISMQVRPGQRVAAGAVVAQLGNIDLEEQIVQMRAELARVKADTARLSGSLMVQRENTAAGELQLARRQREYGELETEEQQIRAVASFGQKDGKALTLVNGRPVTLTGSLATERFAEFPPAIAALQAEVALRQARLIEANNRLQRAQTLFADHILSRGDLESTEANASSLASDLAATRQRLRAALVEHRRRYESVETDFGMSQASLAAGRAQEGNLHAQLDATYRLRESLEERLALLERKRALFALVAPAAGTILGEDLPGMGGRFVARGTEICRIADTSELLVRVQVSEREIGDIRQGCPVRLKCRAFPDRVFRGIVSRIGAESESDQNGQATYRVELTIQNEQALLKPGMSVFARIDFSRRLTGWILAHKLKQALRPEMWML